MPCQPGSKMTIFRKNKYPCYDSFYGCCPDGITYKHDAAGSNCIIPTGCKSTRYGCCPDGITYKDDDAGSNCPGYCKTTTFGCCPDGITPKLDMDGSNCIIPTACASTRYGCCPDGITYKDDDAGSNCPGYHPPTPIKLNYVTWIVNNVPITINHVRTPQPGNLGDILFTIETELITLSYFQNSTNKLESSYLTPIDFMNLMQSYNKTIPTIRLISSDGKEDYKLKNVQAWSKKPQGYSTFSYESSSPPTINAALKYDLSFNFTYLCDGGQYDNTFKCP